MKIPETSANVGAYYGNEENGQWQLNGVIIDSGVGGGVVGSGDAGIHRPVYPVHIPRGHMPGYVMAGAYYPPAYPPAPVPQPDDFADYMWMENEEEFDKQVMQQLEEEALMEQCIEAMLEDEQREKHKHATTSNGNSSLSLEETVSRSTLNPLAAEFVPTFVRGATEEKQESSPAPATSSTPAPEVPSAREEPAPSTDTPVLSDDNKTEECPPPSPPEVSAAEVRPEPPRGKKEPRRSDKKPAPLPKQDIKDTKKVTKPQVVKSEPKLQPKKKDLKPVRSEGKVEELVDKVEEVVIEPVKPQTPTEEPSGPKPINYAAAAKANKPKKPPTPPAEKPPAKLPDKMEKKIKPEKPIQRKNSAK